jgi:catechol 1,2-dioxygenase
MSSNVVQPLNMVPDKSDENPAPNHVNSANGTNGTAASNRDATKTSRFDPHFTEAVIKATGPKANPRFKKVMASLTRHLHDFCRENEVTVDEFMAGIELVSSR